MTNWTNQQKPNNSLMSAFPSNEVKKYIGINNGFPSGDTARWFLDSFQLANESWPNNYGDYSFIVVPASKALENWIFKLAKDLGVVSNTNRAGVIRNQIEKHLDESLLGIETHLGDAIKIDFSYLKNFIQEYRNDIVHCSKKIESSESAKNKVITIYEIVNSITEKLINTGIVKVL
jgi:hypothetical protein